MKSQPTYIRSLQNLLSQTKTRLFLISFLILFFELVLIRYIPAQIRYIGFFSNIILLASFVGIGAGSLFYKNLKIPGFLLPVSLFTFEFIIGLLKYDLVVTSDQVVFFNTGFGQFTSEPAILIPIIFFAVVLVFIQPAQIMAELFAKLNPLEAYSINILGSIAGIILFALLSFLSLGPIIWFPLAFIVSTLIIPFPKIKLFRTALVLLFFSSILFEIQNNYIPSIYINGYKQLLTAWSPYYKISLFEFQQPSDTQAPTISLNVNNIGHQSMQDPDGANVEPFYQYPYQVFPNRQFKRVLVIGAGAGNDVVKALRQGAESVTAVEIDHKILELGEKYNPYHPYSDPRVKTVVADGRAFLVNNQDKYDLIIFALTDSLTLTSAASNLRLESYLFTEESIRDAQRSLSPDGLLIFYNFYRSNWIVDKLAILHQTVFNRPPFIYVNATHLGPAAVIISSNDQQLSMPASNYSIEQQSISIPTDDWPFLYLKDKQIPTLYWSYLGPIVLIVAIGFIVFLKKTKTTFTWNLFFLGAAFMLLEAKSIVQFALLFGSTWLTNALVITGILSMVLVAIRLASIYPKLSLNKLYVLLFILIAINYIFPQRELLNLAYIPRLVASIALNFSPVFVANLIFAQLFKQTKISPLAYGANIMGSFAGGIMEYTSLIFGYKNLMLVVGVLYLLALLSSLKKR